MVRTCGGKKGGVGPRFRDGRTLDQFFSMSHEVNKRNQAELNPTQLRVGP